MRLPLAGPPPESRSRRSRSTAARPAAVAAGFANEAYSLVRSDSPQTTPAMGIPLTWVYVIPLAGFTLTVLHALLGAGLTALRGLLGRDPGGQPASEPGADDAGRSRP